MEMVKQTLSEDDISVKFVTPAIVRAGWDELTQIRRQVTFTKGRLIVRGRLVTRGRAKRADIILYYAGIPIAIIEIKDNRHTLGAGMQQGLEYAQILDVPFVFATNGDGFVFHDRTGQGAQLETTLSLDQFPTPADLWIRYRTWKGLGPEQETLVPQPSCKPEPVSLTRPGRAGCRRELHHLLEARDGDFNGDGRGAVHCARRSADGRDPAGADGGLQGRAGAVAQSWLVRRPGSAL